MERPPSLPLPLDALPEALRRFCNPNGPAPARLMAARGLVPVRGHDQVTMLAQLSADPEQQIAETATDALLQLPGAMRLGACDAPLNPSVLDRLANLLWKDSEALAKVAANPATADGTVAYIARSAPEAVCERIATNQQRLLGAPGIIEALYKNPQTRMSTADRLVELATRNGVELEGIPAFKDHAEALQEQLIPEPSDEPLPGDILFQESLQVDGDDAEAIERDQVDGSEAIKEKFKPLAMRIADMTRSEKIRLAAIGNAAARAILSRDQNRQVALAAVTSPMFTLKEATEIAYSRAVSEDILRQIANRREWLQNGELKRALVFNPKAPLGLSLRFLGHLRLQDLRALMRSKNVASQIKAAASQHVIRREKLGKG